MVQWFKGTILMGQPFGVIAVDPHPIWRLGVGKALKDARDLDLVADGSSVDDVRPLTAKLRPKIILVDGPVVGAGAVRSLVQENPDARVAVFTASERREDLERSIAAGAYGYLLKSISSDELNASLRALLKGERYITPSFATRMLATISVIANNRNRAAPREKLTHRETQILAEAAKGHTNKEIAIKFKITEKTVKYYMTIVLQKLQVRNRVEATNAYREMMSSN